MIKSLEVIQSHKLGTPISKLKAYPWLEILKFSKANTVNLENVKSISSMSKTPVLDYVTRTLTVLDSLALTEEVIEIVETVLLWSDIAKCGFPQQRREWEKQGFNLDVHNFGSADIFFDMISARDDRHWIIYTLIKTHGLIGQFIRGEVNLSENIPLTRLVEENMLTKEELHKILVALNHCIIAGVFPALWDELKEDVLTIIGYIVNNDYDHELTQYERLKRLRQRSIKNGEDFDQEYTRMFAKPQVEEYFRALFTNTYLWYVEVALYDFTFEEFVKVFLLCKPILEDEKNRFGLNHLDFRLLMNDMYYDHDGLKHVNLYKKRIFEKYLSEMTVDQILSMEYTNNMHVKHVLKNRKKYCDTFAFTFEFSKVSEKLIEFCVEAEKADQNMEKAIILLYDYFGLRHDQYDRFYNEESYLKTMNQTIDLKRIILDYVVGDKVLDIGPGGGALLDEIMEMYPDIQAVGIDFSANVVDALKKRKQLERLTWDVQYGNALELEEYLNGNVDTIIFCSIIHELYSYIEWDGKKFNTDTIKAALKSAFRVLNKGGRIIIRDGIMSEPKDAMRIIRFKSSEDMQFVKRYVSDFKGRTIDYQVVGHNEIKLPINDAMELLYTYTWGENSYVHEVQEQFAYFTPSEYKTFIRETLGEEAKVVTLKHYLQEGYTVALSPKIDFFDENHNPVPLPDSTSLIVIEKG